MKSLSNRLFHVIQENLSELKNISSEIASSKPRDDKWSRKEILGHLIDSAANNHQRFVRIQNQEDLIFQGYDQDQWVAVQWYQGKEWGDIISLWYKYNEHLVQVIENIPDSIMTKTRIKHNLHQIAFKTIPESESTILKYFVEDYIDHMEYHLDQIFNYPYDS